MGDEGAGADVVQEGGGWEAYETTSYTYAVGGCWVWLTKAWDGLMISRYILWLSCFGTIFLKTCFLFLKTLTMFFCKCKLYFCALFVVLLFLSHVAESVLIQNGSGRRLFPGLLLPL